MDAEDLSVLLSAIRAPARIQRKIQQQSNWSTARRLLTDAQQARPAELQRAAAWLKQPNHHLLDWFSPTYPELLRAIPQPPLALFVHGNPDLLQRPQIGIVGSRKASPVGLHSATHFATGLARAGIIVSSGLALGIDSAAHRAALSENTTMAVLATGPDIYYPPRNRQLQQQIAQGGLLVTEFPPGVTARRDHFPRRNRILSGLSQGILVIEAQRQSGSLITARLAAEHNRAVLALPGSIWDPAMAGCHQLIREGATLVTAVDEVLEELNFAPVPTSSNHGKENKCCGSLANLNLLANVGNETTSVDTIIARSGLPVAIVTEQLVLLELEGHIVSVAGGYIKMGRR
ncbi:DNA-processing protein DprA [Pseudidiomarina sp.]|uniref:DNA-processing protein DprA n=1 Tax=Pseudidiomarina sp. TaxID=2081707 RepID=UPI00299D36C2|nr:DNA-processing protein DprA [Pseudidiomarina sp.]MDX1706461.1 DNA-processing protein DprA [Pseudidiomarina sp.]